MTEWLQPLSKIHGRMRYLRVTPIASASMKTDTSSQGNVDNDVQMSDSIKQYKKWDPAEAHAKVFDGDGDPAGNTDGDTASLKPLQSKHDVALLANNRCADEILHAMRSHPTTPSNILLNSMTAIIPPNIWSSIVAKDPAQTRYTLTWIRYWVKKTARYSTYTNQDINTGTH